jgi:CRP-like cAMP-binding protein
MLSPVSLARAERNQLLAALPQADYDALLSQLEPVQLGHREVLSVRDEPLPAVVFPRGAVVSLVVPMDDGMLIEGATIGDEGLIGLPILLGDGTATDDTICQIPGEAARMDPRAFRDCLDESAALEALLRRYTLALMGQITRTAGCNRVHPIEQRCARWLLMTRDRVGRDEFPLTHEFLAVMLGVRRPSVSVAAGILQQAGLIDYRRGQMRILEPRRLEAAACEDYRVTREIYAQLFARAAGAELLR